MGPRPAHYARNLYPNWTVTMCVCHEGIGSAWLLSRLVFRPGCGEAVRGLGMGSRTSESSVPEPVKSVRHSRLWWRR